MKTLVAEFQERYDNPRTDHLMDNLGIVVTAHDRRPINMSIDDERRARADQLASGAEDLDTITLDRTIDVLASYHGLEPEQLVKFADGGVVVDIGAGKSSFLDSFTGASSTVAVDRRREYTVHQEANGHDAIVARAHDLHKIPSASVRLAHASFSVPFWAASTLEASGAASEYLRILEPGGLALVGPLVPGDIHRHYEHVVETSRYNGPDTLPWPLERDGTAYLSQVLSSFTKAVLGRRTKHGGDIDITGYRIMFLRERDYYEQATVLHVPNFLMIRKK